MNTQTVDSTLSTAGVQLTGHWKLRFVSIWAGQALSLTGSALTQFVLLWWITTTVGTPSALAIAGIMAFLPQALIGPLGGTVADRFSRRIIMIAADSVTAVCTLILLSLFAAGAAQLWHVYALMFIRSCMQAFQQPAAAASTAMLVPESWVPRVAGMNQTLQGVMTVVGAPLGALALAFLPLQGALAIDVVTALLGIVPLLFFAIPQHRAPQQAQDNFADDFKIGVRYVATHRGLRALYGILGLVVLTVIPTLTLMPLLVRQHFGGGVNEAALMEAVAGAGIIAGGILFAIWGGFKNKVTTLLGAFAVSCAAVALTALMPGSLLLPAAILWFISGAAFSTGNAPFTALLQTTVPNHMQGRVLSLLGMVMGLAAPLGLAIAGPLGEALGVRGVFIAGGMVSTIICLLAFASRDIRQLGNTKAPVTGSMH